MYALIGNPLSHSFSADFFNDKFKKENINEYYKLAPLTHLADLSEFLNANPDLKGFNVTIPYKESIIPFLDSLSSEAFEIGAVNVVKIDTANGQKKLKGYNTDAIGFKTSIMPLLKPYMKHAIILGTGGASNAVDFVLRSIGLETIKVSRRKTSGQLTYPELSEEVLAKHTVIVNTTPLGMWPHTDSFPDMPYHFITPAHLCFDLIYNPDVTAFMRKASEQGAIVKNGLEMLHLQALAAWDIWNK